MIVAGHIINFMGVQRNYSQSLPIKSVRVLEKSIKLDQELLLSKYPLNRASTYQMGQCYEVKAVCESMSCVEADLLNMPTYFNWIEIPASNGKVGGSNPSVGTNSIKNSTSSKVTQCIIQTIKNKRKDYEKRLKHFSTYQR